MHMPDQAAEWLGHLRNIADNEQERTALAGLSAWLVTLGPGEITAATAEPPSGLSDFHANYVAAMVEHACAARIVPAPRWTREIAPLAYPVFATELTSLRLHLLTHSPPAFRRRNLFVDTVVGGQV